MTSMEVPKSNPVNNILKMSNLSRMDIDEDSKAMSSDDEAFNQPISDTPKKVFECSVLCNTMKTILSNVNEKLQSDDFLNTVRPFGSKKKKETSNNNKKQTSNKKPLRIKKKSTKSRDDNVKKFETSSVNLTLPKQKKKTRRVFKPQQRRQFEKILHGEQRAGKDVYFSSKDQPLNEIGKNGGSYIKQNVKHYAYDNLNQASRDQSQEWKWEIWLDPSAPAHIIHPEHTLKGKKDSKVLLNTDPTKINLKEHFGNGVEFIYISPPWKSTNFGYGEEGFFTVEHLRQLDLSEVQQRGFVFIWVKWDDIIEIINIFTEEKGYTYSDSTAAIVSTWQDGISVSQRNPNADENDVLGRMCGNKVHGILFKKKEKAAKRFRIGNQIICDSFMMRQKRDPSTGQQYMDHGYVYQMYQYLIVEKSKGAAIQALHLYSKPKLNINHWGGVSYFPEKQ